MPGSEFIKVTTRVRPSSSCNPQGCIVNVIDTKNLSFNPRNPRNFTFDAVFNKDVTQEQVFNEVASHIIDGCVEGFNGTIFAYGQTGSGKTHTMLGPSKVENVFLNAEHRGLIPRACDALFMKLCTTAAEKGENYKYEVTCKFVELYNEELFDLLSNSQQKLTIRSDSKAVQILGVSEHPVHSSSDMMRIRTEEIVNTLVNKKCATLNLVDLAGSERQAQAKTVGDRFKETVNINLVVLFRDMSTLQFELLLVEKLKIVFMRMKIYLDIL
ncbi:kinesin motor domain protein, partial [Ostertagia ostertagi]